MFLLSNSFPNVGYSCFQFWSTGNIMRPKKKRPHQQPFTCGFVSSFPSWGLQGHCTETPICALSSASSPRQIPREPAFHLRTHRPTVLLTNHIPALLVITRLGDPQVLPEMLSCSLLLEFCRGRKLCFCPPRFYGWA